MSKSLNIDAMFPWEVGIIIIILGLILILLGTRQSKKEINSFDDIPFSKPTTKIIFGSTMLLIGLIQILPLLKG